MRISEDKSFILKDSFFQCVCNHYTQSSYQLMFHNERSWTAILKYSRMND